jgi:hypothetical protein
MTDVGAIVQAAIVVTVGVYGLVVLFSWLFTN